MDDTMNLEKIFPDQIMPASPYVDITYPSTGRSVELAWGSGNTADVKFDFKLEWSARKLTGHLCIFPKNGAAGISTSDVKAAFFSGYNGIIAVFRAKQNGQIRDIVISANENLYNEPARFHTFSGAIHNLERLMMGGALISGDIYVETPWKEKVKSKSSFTSDSKDELINTAFPRPILSIPGLHLAITNLNGNSNELEFVPPDISQIQGSLEDINSESVKQFINAIQFIKEQGLSENIQITIPIYIINITNVLTNGSKNSIEVEK